MLKKIAIMLLSAIVVIAQLQVLYENYQETRKVCGEYRIKKWIEPTGKSPLELSTAVVEIGAKGGGYLAELKGYQLPKQAEVGVLSDGEYICVEPSQLLNVNRKSDFYYLVSSIVSILILIIMLLVLLGGLVCVIQKLNVEEDVKS